MIPSKIERYLWESNSTFEHHSFETKMVNFFQGHWTCPVLILLSRNWNHWPWAGYYPFTQNYDLTKIMPITLISKIQVEVWSLSKSSNLANWRLRQTLLVLRKKCFWLAATTITGDNSKTNDDQAVFYFEMVADGAAFLLRPQRSHHDATTLLVR